MASIMEFKKWDLQRVLSTILCTKYDGAKFLENYKCQKGFFLNTCVSANAGQVTNDFVRL